MLATIITVSVLVSLPLLIKLGILYFAYIEWALSLPFPFRVSLGRRKQEEPIKKSPIGFAPIVEEPVGTMARKKK